MAEKKKIQIGVLFSKEEKEVLQGIAEAFEKSGVIEKATIPQLIQWNMRKLMVDVITRRREQLRQELSQQVEQEKQLDLMKKYPHIFNEGGVSK